jgi:two-component system sensor histidine kinase UhpB
LLSALTILGAIGVVAVSAASIRRMDLLRLAAEEEMRTARDRLETIVLERTEALNASNRELAQRELHYRLLFTQSPQPLWVYDLTSLRFLMVNNAAVALYGYAQEEFLQMTVSDITAPEDAEKLASRATFPASGSTGLWRHRKKDGTFAWVESVGNTIEVNGKTARMVLVRDVTERKQLEEELAQEHERYRALAAHLLQLQDRERLHLSREIHDTFGQELTGVKFQLQALASSTAADGRIGPMLTALDEVMRKLREVAAHLRPPILDHLSLPDALEWLLEQHGERTGLHCEVQIDSFEIAADDEIKMAVFRICQEALTNITRHAHASRVMVSLRCRGALTLKIKDNGVGFDTAKGSTNLGLLGMRERAEAVRGNLQIQSALGSGTEVTLSIAEHLIGAGNESPAV